MNQEKHFVTDRDVHGRVATEIGRRIRRTLPDEVRFTLCRELRELKEESARTVKTLISKDTLLEADREMTRLRIIKDLRTSLCKS